MEQETVPPLFWLSYEAVKPKNIIDNNKDIPYDIRKFKKDIKRGLSGAIKKRDLRLVKYNLWKYKKINKNYKYGHFIENSSFNILLNAIKTDNIDLVKFIIKESNIYTGLNLQNLILDNIHFINFDIFKFLYEKSYEKISQQHLNVHPWMNNNNKRIMFSAVVNDKIDIFKYIPPKITEYVINYLYYFDKACYSGSIECMKYIYYNLLNKTIELEHLENIKDFIKDKKDERFQEVKTFLNELS